MYVGGKGTAYTAKNASEARTALFHANAMRRLPMLKRIDPEGTMSLREIADALNGMARPFIHPMGNFSPTVQIHREYRHESYNSQSTC